MDLAVSGFDWDDGNTAKCQRHGLSIAEIEAVFRGEARVAPDLNHSGKEDRLIAVGRTDSGRPVFVAFTIRTKNGRRLVRPITARYMHLREVRRYDETGS